MKCFDKIHSFQSWPFRNKPPPNLEKKKNQNNLFFPIVLFIFRDPLRLLEEFNSVIEFHRIDGIRHELHLFDVKFGGRKRIDWVFLVDDIWEPHSSNSDSKTCNQ